MNHDAHPPLAAALDFVEQQFGCMVQRLEHWCAVNSGSMSVEDLQRMAALVATDYSSLGDGAVNIPLPAYRTLSDDGEEELRHTGPLLCWHHQPQASKRILLMIHYDTVYSPAAHESMRQRIEGDRFYAPGAADAKGGLMVMLESLRVVRRFGLDAGIGWTAACNPDEEIGSPASRSWMQQHAKEFVFGLLFEPTLPDRALVASRMGSGNFTVVVHGRSAHAGREPAAGRNAVMKLCRILTEVDRLNAASFGGRVNVARFRGGDALNRIPDLAVGRFNIRAQSADSADRFLAALERIIDQARGEEGFRVELHGEFQSLPKAWTTATEQLAQRVVAAGRVAGRSIAWKNTGGVCDGNKLASAGLANIDTLGPDGDGLHSPNEWVDLSSLVPAIKTLVILIADYAAEARGDSSRSREGTSAAEQGEFS